MKNTYYFPHDYHARHDPKLEELMQEIGLEGIGAYWCLIEMLYENGGYLPLDKIDYYAKVMRTHSERITKVIRGFSLFKFDKHRFWSESCLKRLNHLNEKKNKASISALKRWGKDANAMPTQCEGNAIKEIKEKKVNKYTTFSEFVRLTNEQHSSLLTRFGDEGTKERIQRLNDYIGSTGKKYASHYHTILNWERRKEGDNHKVIKMPTL